MKEFNGLFLLAILGLLTIIALSTMLNIYSAFLTIGNILVVVIFVLFFVGLYGLAFMVRKKS